MTGPRADQIFAPPTAVLAPGGAAGVFRGRLVIVIGDTGGVFIYDSAGDLLGSWVGTATTDPIHGAAVPAGLQEIDPATGQGTHLIGSAAVLLGSAFSPGSDGFISGQPAASSAGFSEVFISGPTDDDLLTQFLQRGQSGDGTTVPAAYTVLTGYSLGSNVYRAADFIVIGQVKWAAAGSLGVTAETWHSLGASGATGFTDVKNSYRMNVFNEVEFDIQLTAGGGGGTAGIYTYANTLPAAYRPTVNRAYPLGVQGTWLAAGARFPILKVFTTGQVDIHLPAASANGNTGGLPVMPLD